MIGTGPMAGPPWRLAVWPAAWAHAHHIHHEARGPRCRVALAALAA
jgi:hypothetical protein